MKNSYPKNNTTQLVKLGNRKYIQGTTIFEALIDKESKVELIDFQLKRIIFNSRVNIYSINSWEVPKEAHAVLYYTKAGQKEAKFVFPSNDTVPENRVDFDESPSLFKLEWEQNRVRIIKTPYNFIKTIVAVNKMLINDFPKEDELLLFAQIKTANRIESANDVELVFMRKLGDFYHSKIQINSKELGVISFMKYSREKIDSLHNEYLRKGL